MPLIEAKQSRHRISGRAAECAFVPASGVAGRLARRRQGRLKNEGSFRFVQALDDISFTLKQGDRLGLLGHNGAGKTTLIRVLAGIYEPTTRIAAHGRPQRADVRHRPRHGRRGLRLREHPHPRPHSRPQSGGDRGARAGNRGIRRARRLSGAADPHLFVGHAAAAGIFDRSLDPWRHHPDGRMDRGRRRTIPQEDP